MPANRTRDKTSHQKVKNIFLNPGPLCPAVPGIGILRPGSNRVVLLDRHVLPGPKGILDDLLQYVNLVSAGYLFHLVHFQFISFHFLTIYFSSL